METVHRAKSQHCVCLCSLAGFLSSTHQSEGGSINPSNVPRLKKFLLWFRDRAQGTEWVTRIICATETRLQSSHFHVTQDLGSKIRRSQDLPPQDQSAIKTRGSGECRGRMTSARPLISLQQQLPLCWAECYYFFSGGLARWEWGRHIRNWRLRGSSWTEQRLRGPLWLSSHMWQKARVPHTRTEMLTGRRSALSSDDKPWPHPQSSQNAFLFSTFIFHTERYASIKMTARFSIAITLNSRGWYRRPAKF